MDGFLKVLDWGVMGTLYLPSMLCAKHYTALLPWIYKK